MPEVVSYTAEWLSRPSNGAKFFETIAQSTESRSRRNLAIRNAEVFFATGSEIRWGDLNLIEAKHQDDSAVVGRGWRVLKSPTTLPIEQLSVSPDGNLLAVMTKHTCHMCILPTPTLLRSGDEGILRLKSFQVGPAAHVLEQSPIVRCLWHPLSTPALQCLVTITLDASVRLWELDVNNRYSFDQPSLAVSLVKLASATSSQADLSAAKFGANRGFSPDDVEMEVSAACFGGEGSEDEYGWASMTLWVAMSEGDIYALCPLLPSQFRLSSSTLPTLSTSVIAEAQIVAADSHATDAERRKVQTQSEWLTDLDDQEPMRATGENEFDVIDVYVRPEGQAAIARLQGPFQLDYDLADAVITDIIAFPPVIDDAQLYDEDEYRGAPVTPGLSLSTLFVATSAAEIHVCLPTENVEAQWLPPKQSRAISLEDEMYDTDLLLYQTVVLGDARTTPTFTTSPLDRYEVLVTTDYGVFNVDCNPWIQELEDELAAGGSSGMELRLETLLESLPTFVTGVVMPSSDDALQAASTAVTILDPNLGLIVLTIAETGAHAAALGLPYDYPDPYDSEQLALPAPELRESYQVSPAFYATSDFEKTMTARRATPQFKIKSGGPLLALAEPEAVRFITEAHRMLSKETNRLGLAAADLFRRCERMRLELHSQIRKLDDITQKVATVTGMESTEDDEGDEDLSVDAKIDQRIMSIRSDASHMNERLETLRRKMLRLGGEELSTKERAFIEEIHHLQELTGDESYTAPVDSTSLLTLPDKESDLDTSAIEHGLLSIRLQNAANVSEGLIAQVDDIVSRQEAKPKRNVGGMNEFKKHKLEKVMEMLERESALVQAVSERLARLSGGHS